MQKLYSVLDMQNDRLLKVLPVVKNYCSKQFVLNKKHVKKKFKQSVLKK